MYMNPLHNAWHMLIALSNLEQVLSSPLPTEEDRVDTEEFQSVRIWPRSEKR